jgi:hypothetical protein
MTVPVDNEMLANSVTFQGANMTARDILEPATYDRLVESKCLDVSVILSCQKAPWVSSSFVIEEK